MKNNIRFKRLIKFLLALIVFAHASVLAQPAIQWQKTIGGNQYDQVNAIISTSDGGYILGGYSNSLISGDKSEEIPYGQSYWIVKVTADGIKEWDKTIGQGNNGDDQLTSVLETDDGG
ncbi:hypothetical protein FEM33_17000 [Dyadobacter flavalbus]|uniref:T9SS C-terminal target domain-containing protein n=1 Tax=Dyadobacter flavalbus TaxID=2579942 RepID=A0A5M8QSY1_9BACT|nr:hypothetical protein [Dyadobacter flavalbus]KAA6438388.1 hypothetical protein FEM33_17000 [Dyadobacter flavalbus]